MKRILRLGLSERPAEQAAEQLDCGSPVLPREQRQCSGSEAIAAIGVGQNAHHFVEGCNLEVEN